jgi:hypothetical protein
MLDRQGALPNSFDQVSRQQIATGSSLSTGRFMPMITLAKKSLRESLVAVLPAMVAATLTPVLAASADTPASAVISTHVVASANPAATGLLHSLVLHISLLWSSRLR